MKKIKWLKDWKNRKVGDISEAGESSAKNFVDQGYAEYVDVWANVEEKVKELGYNKVTPDTLRLAKMQMAIKEEDVIITPLEQEVIQKEQAELESKKKEAKYWADVHIIETEKINNKDEAIAKGILPENYDLYKRRNIEFNTEQFEKKERTNEQIEAQLRNDCLLHMAAKQYSDATEKIAQYILNNNYIYTTRDDNKAEMWIYDSGIYIPQGKSYIKEITDRILQKGYKQSIVNEVIAKIEARTFIDHDKFFETGDKYELPVMNGVLNIKTRELKPFSPEKIFFNKCPVFYNKNADCPNIDKFLSDVLKNPEDKTVFYEIGGFGLLKEYRWEKAFMFVGNGRNGKGKSLELMKRVLGAENTYCLPLSALTSDNPNVSQLHGKLLNLAGDIGSSDLKDTSMFKGLTGRDLITSPRKYLRALTFENYAKFVFACNELPMVYDLSKGFWDRWVLLEYPYYFADKTEFDKAKEEDRKNWKVKDENIIDKIATTQELSGLFNKFLDGLDRLFQNHKFSSTKGSEQVKELWIRKSNSFIAFAMEELEEDYESKISKKQLRNYYSKFCKEHKVTPKSDVVVKRVLQDQFGASDEKSDDGFGKWEWHWVGIKWKKKYVN